MEQFSITYLGHACFCLETAGYRTVLDPYADAMVPGLPPLRVEAEAVYCSHDHNDHNFVQAVHLTGKAQHAPYTVEEFTVPHDGEGGRLRGMNTVRAFSVGDLRIVHFGDLGRRLTQAEAERLSGADCILLPVGGYYTIDARTAAEVVDQVRPRVVIPMHYRTDRTGFPQISLLEEFTGLFPAVRWEGASMTLDKTTPPGVAVLTPEVLLQEN